MRRWRIRILLVPVLLALIVPGILAAAAPADGDRSPRIADGEGRVVIASGETLTDDLIVYTDQGVTVDGTLKGDLIILGPEVVINGTVEGDVVGFSERVWITGTVQGSVRVAVIDAIRVDGTVGRSLNTLASQATLGPQGKVGSSWLALGGQLELLGEVGRSLWAQATELTVSGRVGRDLTVTDYTRATLGTTAVVQGTFWATGEEEPTVSQGASVSEVRFTPVAAPLAETAWLRLDQFAVLRITGFAAIGLLLSWLAPGLLRSFRRRLTGHFWPSLGAGAAVLVGVPVLTLVLMLTVAGLPAALLGLLPLYTAALYLGQMLTAGWLGHLILSRVRRDDRVNRFGAFLLGLVCLTLLTRLPYVRYIASFVSMALALGGLGLTIGPWIRRIASED